MNTYMRAGVITLLVFLSGIMFGIWIDNYRLSAIRQTLSEVDINWNDARMLSIYFERIGIDSCDIALQSNLDYNEKIYKEGIEIERSVEANIFTPELEQELRRYVLLQLQFWFNSIELKEKCGFDYNTVVHLYKQEDLTQVEKAENKAQSTILLDLKEKCGNKIMLIPLTADLQLTSIDSIINQYNIAKFPAIIIDEEIIFQGLTSLSQLEEVVQC